MDMDDIEIIIKRIRNAIHIGVDRETIHHEMVTKGGISEEMFYLCYKAAEVLGG